MNGRHRHPARSDAASRPGCSGWSSCRLRVHVVLLADARSSRPGWLAHQRVERDRRDGHDDLARRRRRRPAERRHDVDRRPAGAGADAARRAKRESRSRPPAAKTPEMTVPDARRDAAEGAPSPAVKQAPDEARGRTPTRGAETAAGQRGRRDRRPRAGLRAVDRRRRRASGSTLDVADFCCPDYIDAR